MKCTNQHIKLGAIGYSNWVTQCTLCDVSDQKCVQVMGDTNVMSFVVLDIEVSNISDCKECKVISEQKIDCFMKKGKYNFLLHEYCYKCS